MITHEVPAQNESWAAASAKPPGVSTPMSQKPRNNSAAMTMRDAAARLHYVTPMSLVALSEERLTW